MDDQDLKRAEKAELFNRAFSGEMTEKEIFENLETLREVMKEHMSNVNTYIYELEKADGGNPFTLICLVCGRAYEGCYNNQTCPYCGNTKEIQWILKKEFRDHPDFRGGKADNCKVENMKIDVLCEIDINKN